ncbi:hypothetical protein TRVL_01959 [Trypanosoma vivax]|uniref:Uncharacterized protein n=1 Tax=Trypanosoma vivax (strain Y486) TaxID=1055687 RepID=G0TRJ8_TRYVY|nr:hypothetical protein TRVL_01959 [Trypanosoma vivax]CCC46563.1 conserved hypothetical protein [Trypanosoma vivax Y486]
MSDKRQEGLKEMDGEQHAQVIHSLPIKTTFRGTTDVGENFTSHTVRGDNGELRNALRGRMLIGQEVKLPASHAIVCVSFTNNNTTPTGYRASGTSSAAPPTLLEVSASDVCVQVVTDRFCLWEHDKKPERPDALLHWLELANAIHR